VELLEHIKKMQGRCDKVPDNGICGKCSLRREHAKFLRLMEKLCEYIESIAIIDEESKICPAKCDDGWTRYQHPLKGPVVTMGSEPCSICNPDGIIPDPRMQTTIHHYTTHDNDGHAANR
jgi:hypothetical protein